MRRTILQALGAAACTLVMALPLAAAGHAKTEKKAWSAETLSGKVMMVEPGEHLLVLTGPQGVPFDMTVRPSTVIESNGHRTTLRDLKSDLNDNVSVHFQPRVTGDIAQSINVQS